MTARVLAPLVSEIAGAELVRGPADVVVESVEHDSRSAGPGALFVAVPGFTVDGHAFLRDAVDRGAAAVMVERGRGDAWDGLPGDVPIVALDDTRKGLAAAAVAFYQSPSRHLTVVGVTGTDGKTTTSHLLTSVLEASGAKAGRIGTVDAYVPGADPGHVSERMTTPEAPEIQRILRLMVEAGCEYAVVEATSHGLALHRLDGVEFDIAVFTNITGDHLDFHETFEAYREAKGALFAALDRTSDKGRGVARTAIANADDPSASYMLAQTSAGVLRFGFESPDVDVTARDVDLRANGSSFRLVLPGADVGAEIRLPALFNVANALAAAAAGHAAGLDAATIARGLASCPGVPGRMERVDAGQPFDVVVDYAHTGDAVRKALEVLRQVSKGRLLIVVGAAGERDPGRRFGVARAAAEGADFAVFTNEDPRSEDPGHIVREIGEHAESAGRRRGEDFLEVEDRREAIAEAFRRAQPGDLVVICGKGHERSIELGEHVIPWDDRAVAREELARLGHTAS